MLGFGLWGGIARWRGTLHSSRWLHRAAIAMGPMGFVAVLAGWITTEVGRQPWVIYGYMRTSEAVTPMPGLVVPFTMFTLLYLVLSVLTVLLLRRQFLHSPTMTEEPS